MLQYADLLNLLLESTEQLIVLPTGQAAAMRGGDPTSPPINCGNELARDGVSTFNIDANCPTAIASAPTGVRQ